MIRRNQGGYTLVEVTIALTVTALLIFAIMNFMTNTLVQYTGATIRSDLLSQIHTALDIANNDIRLSASADQNNRWLDPNSPDGDFGWESDGDTLVLATAVEDDEGNILFADVSEYISHKNNVVYFVSEGSLYKRVLAAPVENNTAKTTCPEAQADENCPADRKLLDNVQNFNVSYLDANGQDVAPTDARSVALEVSVHKENFSQPVSVSYKTNMVFRND